MGIPIPSPREIVLVSCIAGAVQLAVALRFRAGMARDRARPLPKISPPATLVIPCCGSLAGLDAALDSFLDQDYHGPLEILFVVPSERDQAHRDLERLRLRRKDRPFRLLASNLVPEHAGGKPQDMAFAFEHAAPESTIFLLTDVDLRVRLDWAQALAGALADPSVGVATAMTPFVRSDSLSGLLRMAWLAYGIPYLEWHRIAIGQSTAIRRVDYEELGLGELWSRSLSEDMSLSRRMIGWPKRVAFVGAAVAPGIDGMEGQGLVTVFNRWTALFRIYRPDVWLQGALFTFFKLFVFLRVLARPQLWALALLVCAWDFAYLWLSLTALGACAPEAGKRRRPFLTALTAPLVTCLFAVNFACTIIVRRLRWGRYLYRVRGPQKISVPARQ